MSTQGCILLHVYNYLCNKNLYVCTCITIYVTKKNLDLDLMCLLGVKIIGGYRELSGEEFGIFIKRVLPGGVAARDGMSAPSHVKNSVIVFL